MQEQQEPVPIHMRIDTQEQRSGIPDLLATMPQIHVEMIPLQMGDYDVGGDPCQIFKHKTGSDFLCSLAQGRLFPQLAALLKSRFSPILLLEEDSLLVSHSQMRPESIRGALADIVRHSRLNLILSSSGPEDRQHSIFWEPNAVRSEVYMVGVGQAAHGLSAGRRRATQAEQADAHPAVPARHISRPPHVRSARAFAVRYHLLSADAA